MDRSIARRTAAGAAALLLLAVPGTVLGAESAPPAVAPAVPLTPQEESEQVPAVAPAVPLDPEKVQVAPAVPLDPGKVQEANVPAPAVSAEEALALVKRYFKIPESPGRLEARLSDEKDRFVWDIIYWIDHENGSTGNGIGTVDAATGRILSVNLGSGLDGLVRPPQTGPLNAPHSEEEARNRAWALVRELYPEEADVLRPAPDGFRGISFFAGLDAYSFTWTAYHQDVPVLASTVRVEVDRFTLDYLSLSADLREDLIYPEGTAALTPEEALARYLEAAAPTLQYQPIYPDYPYMGKPVPELKLVYRVRLPGLLDAVTGKFLTQTGEAAASGASEAVPAGSAPVKPAALPLTEAEAVAFARQVLELPEEAEIQAVPAGEEPVMHLHWYDGKSSANLSVDKETGMILHAYLDAPGSEGPEEETAAAPTAEQKERATQEAIRVVQRLYSDWLPDLKLDPEAPIAFFGERGTVFHFQRYLNGIPFAYDGVTVTVDPTTGKWTQLSASWGEAEKVPEPEGVISAEEAREAFFGGRAAQLVYQPVVRPGVPIGRFAPDEPTELMLVYQLLSTDPAAASSYGIDAFTGKPLTAAATASPDREALDEQLSGHWAEGELRFAIGQGWISPAGLDPDGEVTRMEALAMLIPASNRYRGYGGGMWEVPYTDVAKGGAGQELLVQGIALGVLRPEGTAPVFGGDEVISRGEFALWMARSLKLGDLAASDLLTEPGFTDAAALTAEQRNAVAFLEALDILASGGPFRGEEAMTQAEAAALVVRLLDHLQPER